MKRFLIAVVNIVLLSSMAAANYWCDCSLKTPKQWFQAADAVFIGVVASPGKDNGRAGAMAHFKVTQALKGHLPEKIAIGYDFGGSQAVRFEKGKSYLVYAVGDMDKSGFMTDSCCGTKSLGLAKDDLAIINASSTDQK